MSGSPREIFCAHGAEYRRIEGEERIDSFGDVAAEYGALLRGAGLVDRFDRAHFELSGKDARSFLSRLLSNDIDSLPAGETMEALLLTPRGMLISPVSVFAEADRFLLVTPEATGDEVAGKLGMYVLSSEVEIGDRRGETGQVGVFGPRSGEVVARVGKEGALVTPSRDLGVEGFDVRFPRDEAESVVGRLLLAGARPAGWSAAEAVRIVCGEARFGAETTPGMLPPEVPALAERAISYEKGCYVGQETISRLAHYGRVNRELRGLVLGGKKVPEAGAVVSRSGKKVGTVTSACIPPDRETPIALGFVHRKHFDPGTPVEVELPGGVSLATVVDPREGWEV